MSQSNPKNARPTGWLRDHRLLLRAEAELRQAERDRRTPEQQLARLDERGYTAERERGRLADQIAHPFKK